MKALNRETHDLLDGDLIWEGDLAPAYDTLADRLNWRAEGWRR